MINQFQLSNIFQNSTEVNKDLIPTSSYNSVSVTHPQTGAFREPRDKSTGSRTTSATRPAYGSKYLKNLRNPKP